MSWRTEDERKLLKEFLTWCNWASDDADAIIERFMESRPETPGKLSGASVVKG